MTSATTPNAKDVTILGAGIIGVCCALSLLESGYNVTLIDKDDPGEATSFGNAGVISPWSCVPQCLPGVWRNVPKWVMEKDGPVTFDYRHLPKFLPWAFQFFKNGTPTRVNKIADTLDMLMSDNITAYRRYLKGTGQEHLLVDSLYVNVFRGHAKPNLDDMPWRLRLDRNAPIEVIGQGDLSDLEPALSRDCHSAIIIKDQARAVSPGKLCKVLAEKAKQQGAVFLRMDVEALKTGSDGSVTLQSQGKGHHCQKLVLAAGYRSAELLKSLGTYMPLISERGYHAEFKNPGLTLNNSIMDVAGKFVVSSMLDGVRAAGTTEFANHDAPPNYERSKSLQKLAQTLLPEIDAEDTSYWMGVRPSFPDNLPAIGTISGHSNIYAAFGHSHYGMGLAPATGRIVASLFSGKALNFDLSAVMPSRFL